MLKLKSLTEILLSVYLVRLLITGASVGDALALAGLAALQAFQLYLEQIKMPDPTKELKERLSAVETRLVETQNKVTGMTLSNTLTRR